MTERGFWSWMFVLVFTACAVLVCIAAGFNPVAWAWDRLLDLTAHRVRP